MKRHMERRYYAEAVETLRLWKPECGRIWEVGRKKIQYCFVNNSKSPLAMQLINDTFFSEGKHMVRSLHWVTEVAVKTTVLMV